MAEPVEMTPGEPEENTTANETAELEGLSIEGGDFAPGPEDVASPSPEPETPDIPTDQILLMAIGPLFDIFAPAWNVTEQEKAMLAGAYAQVVDKYFPDIAMGPEFTAIAITGMVIAPRIGQPMREEEGAEDGDQS